MAAPPSAGVPVAPARRGLEHVREPRALLGRQRLVHRAGRLRERVADRLEPSQRLVEEGREAHLVEGLRAERLGDVLANVVHAAARLPRPISKVVQGAEDDLLLAGCRVEPIQDSVEEPPAKTAPTVSEAVVPAARRHHGETRDTGGTDEKSEHLETPSVPNRVTRGTSSVSVKGPLAARLRSVKARDGRPDRPANATAKSPRNGGGH